MPLVISRNVNYTTEGAILTDCNRRDTIAKQVAYPNMMLLLLSKFLYPRRIFSQGVNVNYYSFVQTFKDRMILHKNRDAYYLFLTRAAFGISCFQLVYDFAIFKSSLTP